MSRFSVDVQGGHNDANRMRDIEREIRSYVSTVTSARSSVNRYLWKYRGVDSSIRTIEASMRSTANSLNRVGNALDRAMYTYESTEHRIMGKPMLGGIGFWGGWDRFINANRRIPGVGRPAIAQIGWPVPVLPGDGIGIISKIGKVIWDIWDIAPGSALIPISMIPVINASLAGLVSVESFTKYLDEITPDHVKFGKHDYSLKTNLLKLKDNNGNEIWGWQKKLNDWNKDHKKTKYTDKNGKEHSLEKKGYWENGQWKDAGTSDEEKNEFNKHNKGIPVDVKLKTVGVEGEWSFIEGSEDKFKETFGDENGSHWGYDVDLLQFKGDAEAYIGVGCIGASAGGSFTVFNAEIEGQLGNDMLGAYGKGEVTAGKAELKIGGQAGFLDKNGNINPSAYINASAEAIAVEAKADVGAKVLGTDVKGSVGVNVGVGAHADIGIHDGKISVDLGASVGVGVSVKLDIDVSGTVDAVCDAAKSVWETGSKVFEGIGKGISKLFGG